MPNKASLVLCRCGRNDLNVQHYPVVYAGDPFRFSSLDECEKMSSMRSAVAKTGWDVSRDDVGFLISVTQKHFAILSSPLTSATLKPRSFRFFIEPRRTQGRVVSSRERPSIGGAIIWLIKSNAFCRSWWLVRLKIVIEQTSCFV